MKFSLFNVSYTNNEDVFHFSIGALHVRFFEYGGHLLMLTINMNKWLRRMKIDTHMTINYDILFHNAFKKIHFK